MGKPWQIFGGCSNLGKKTDRILVRIHVNAKAVVSALAEHPYSVVHIFGVVFPSIAYALRNVSRKRPKVKQTHGPSCSRASHVNGNRNKLKPQPRKRAR
jgi:hypothetical protein